MKDKLYAKTINLETGTETIEEYTAEEYALLAQQIAEAKTEKAQVKKQEATATAKADARTSALNKLSALGLTQEEIDSL